MILAENSIARNWLRLPLPEYLGRVSYSLYLVHGTVIFGLLILLYGRIPLWMLACLYLVITLILSHLFCIFIEEPAMRLGKRLANSARSKIPGDEAPSSLGSSDSRESDVIVNICSNEAPPHTRSTTF